MNPDGSNPHAITSKDDIDPTWSPDGSMIAFASNRSGAEAVICLEFEWEKGRQGNGPEGKWVDAAVGHPMERS